jgi:hypothetical protein
MARQQLPPQIKRLAALDRKTGETVVRYRLRVDAGVNPLTGKRQQVRRRYATEKQARDALSEIGQPAAADQFVPRKAVTVDELMRGLAGLATQCPRDDAQRLPVCGCATSRTPRRHARAETHPAGS